MGYPLIAWIRSTLASIAAVSAQSGAGPRPTLTIHAEGCSLDIIIVRVSTSSERSVLWPPTSS